MFEGQNWEEVRGHWVTQSATYRVASGGYFEAMRIPVRRGRTFDGRDVAGAPIVAVINEAMAARYWPGGDPIGRRIRFAGMDGADDPWLTIVGVVGDVRFRDLATPAAPEVYVHFPQRPARTAYFVTTVVRLRPGATAAVVGPALRAAVAAQAPDVPADLSTMTAVIDRTVAARRFTLLALAVFAGCALALAAVGIYGVIAVVVTQRTAEIGLRLALGARPAAAARAAVEGPLRAVLVGLALGCGLAVGLSGALRAMLYDVTPTDPLAFAAAAGVLAAGRGARRAGSPPGGRCASARYWPCAPSELGAAAAGSGLLVGAAALHHEPHLAQRGDRCVGSPSTATRSASRPALTRPAVGRGGRCRRCPRWRCGRHRAGVTPSADHHLQLAHVVAVREDADVAAEAQRHAGVQRRLEAGALVAAGARAPDRRPSSSRRTARWRRRRPASGSSATLFSTISFQTSGVPASPCSMVSTPASDRAAHALGGAGVGDHGAAAARRHLDDRASAPRRVKVGRASPLGPQR